MRGITWKSATTSAMQRSAFQQSLVADIQISDLTAARCEPSKVWSVAATICSGALGSLSASDRKRFDMDHQYRHSVNARDRDRPGSRCDGASVPHWLRWDGASATSRQRRDDASAISRHFQREPFKHHRAQADCGNRRVPPRRNGLRNRKRRSEGLGRA
jgi:hypothetical protein